MCTRILILGSCVSRDPFARISDSGKFRIVDYYARTSLASLVKKPLSDVDLSTIKSPFQRRMVHRDLQKEFFVALETQTYDVLLMDFIDDRFSLICLPDGSALTDSNELRSSKVSFHHLRPNRISPFSEEFVAAWEIGWCRMKSRLASLGRLDALLINDVLWCDRDDKGSLYENDCHKANKYLSTIYGNLRKDLREDQFVDYRSVEFIGRADHPWGRSPFHYVEEVEEACLASVKRFHHARRDKAALTDLSFARVRSR